MSARQIAETGMRGGPRNAAARAARRGSWLRAAVFTLWLAPFGCQPQQPADDAQSELPLLQAAGDPDRPCFHPELGDFDISCLTEAQLAAVLSDYDKDGRNNLDELKMGGDPYDSSDGPDIDGDGVPNGDDDDTDGDGVPNKHDFDVDNDGLFNGHDPDIDADGLLNADDADSDGDLLTNRFDLNDDGDDEPDDEDEDEDEKEPEKLEGLIERLKDGKLKDADKNAIANEISERLGTLDKQAEFQAAIIDVVAQALSEDREQADTDVPQGIAAVDALYRQLSDSLKYVKDQQKDPKAPLTKEKLREVASDFSARARAVADFGKTFDTISHQDLSAAVSDLRAATGPRKFAEISKVISTLVKPDARGTGEDERRELGIVTEGITRLAQTFPEADTADLLSTYDRLRELAGDDPDFEAAEMTRLLNRMREIADDLPATIEDALAQVEDEEEQANNPPPPNDPNGP